MPNTVMNGSDTEDDAPQRSPSISKQTADSTTLPPAKKQGETSASSAPQAPRRKQEEKEPAETTTPPSVQKPSTDHNPAPAKSPKFKRPPVSIRPPKTADTNKEEPNNNQDYEIAYGKPPRQTQFRKGQSGNSKGRPKGSKNSDTILEETLNRNLMVRENGSTYEISVREVAIRKQAELALKGDQRAIKFLFDRDDQLAARLKAKAQGGDGDELEGVEMDILNELKRQVIEEHEAVKNKDKDKDIDNG